MKEGTDTAGRIYIHSHSDRGDDEDDSNDDDDIDDDSGDDDIDGDMSAMMM